MVNNNLVGGARNHGFLNDFPETVGNGIIIPTDFHIFQRGRSTRDTPVSDPAFFAHWGFLQDGLDTSHSCFFEMGGWTQMNFKLSSSKMDWYSDNFEGLGANDDDNYW